MFPFMLPFLSPQAMSLMFPLNAPLSGNVTQDINPITSWLSPQVEFNFAGKREVETDVVSNIASYGKQLGTIIPALLELAGETQGPALDELRALEAKIELTKEKHRNQQTEILRAELTRLKQNDPEALKALLSDFG
jgi:hypothetical protein